MAVVWGAVALRRSLAQVTLAFPGATVQILTHLLRSLLQLPPQRNTVLLALTGTKKSTNTDAAVAVAVAVAAAAALRRRHAAPLLPHAGRRPPQQVLLLFFVVQRYLHLLVQVYKYCRSASATRSASAAP